MDATFKSVQTSFDVTENMVRNLLVSAFEGGSGYWMYILKYEFPPNTSRKDFIEGGKHAVKDDVLHDYISIPYLLPFVKGAGVVLQDKEEDATYTLTKEKMENGLSVMANKYPKHFQNIVDGNDDAETADVFLQCALFGEIVYG